MGEAFLRNENKGDIDQMTDKKETVREMEDCSDKRAFYGRPIRELLGLKFLVSEFQRGFKWTPLQVCELLQDLADFDPSPDRRSYCLQPVVVKHHPETDCWELIDGQQRVTTIFLILTFLGRPSFQIEYRTRPGSREFLDGIASFAIGRGETWDGFLDRQGRNLDNVDTFHFFQAWQAISAWFDGKPGQRESWAGTLLEYGQVLWYDPWHSSSNYERNKASGGHVPEAIDCFIRLNSGKIPLTNAELIKPLFLADRASSPRASSFRPAEIAREWDEIERRLLEPPFWGFIRGSGRDAPPNRIELLFDHVSDKNRHCEDPFHSFRFFTGSLDLENDWKKVRSCFERLSEWFGDDEKYHLVGYLANIGRRPGRVSELLSRAEGMTRRAFTGFLRDLIRKETHCDDFLNWRYGEHNALMKNFLLLFNIEYLLKCCSDERFPFHRFAEETWSLEHIHARQTPKLGENAAAEAWYEEIVRLLAGRQGTLPQDSIGTLRQRLEDWHGLPDRNSPEARSALEDLHARLFVIFGEVEDDEGTLDSIENLTLLDRDTNSSLNNSLFPVKRDRVREWERKARFIPIATRNVFLKYFPGATSHLDYWGEADRRAYAAEMRSILAAYFKEEQGQ